jgi:hypothetical protein
MRLRSGEAATAACGMPGRPACFAVGPRPTITPASRARVRAPRPIRGGLHGACLDWAASSAAMKRTNDHTDPGTPPAEELARDDVDALLRGLPSAPKFVPIARRESNGENAAAHHASHAPVVGYPTPPPEPLVVLEAASLGDQSPSSLQGAAQTAAPRDPAQTTVRLPRAVDPAQGHRRRRARVAVACLVAFALAVLIVAVSRRSSHENAVRASSSSGPSHAAVVAPSTALEAREPAAAAAHSSAVTPPSPSAPAPPSRAANAERPTAPARTPSARQTPPSSPATAPASPAAAPSPSPSAASPASQTISAPLPEPDIIGPRFQ